MDDLEQRLREAFNRARYEGEGDYNPDGDLFEAAADRLRQYRARDTGWQMECEELREALREIADAQWPDVEASTGIERIKALARQALDTNHG